MRSITMTMMLCLVAWAIQAQLSYLVVTPGASVVNSAEIHVHGFTDNQGQLINDGIIYCDADFACEGPYSGAGEISLQSALPSEIYVYDSLQTLTVNKPGANIQVPADLFVKSLFDLQNGVFDLVRQTLHIGTPTVDGTALGGDASSFVRNGEIIQNYTSGSTMRWPVGEGIGHPVDMEIVSIDPGSHWISGQFYSGQHLDAPASPNSYDGHWQFDHSGIANMEVNVVAQMHDELVTGLLPDLSLFGWSDPLWRGAIGSGADIEEGTFFIDPSPNLATWNGITEITDLALFSWPMGCTGDFDSNGTINTADMLMLLTEYGCMADCLYDLTGDGQVDTADLLEFLTLFGTDCL